jgi:hypothetical protein
MPSAMRPRSAMSCRWLSRRLGTVSAVLLGMALDRGGGDGDLWPTRRRHSRSTYKPLFRFRLAQAPPAPITRLSCKTIDSRSAAALICRPCAITCSSSAPFR